MVLGAIDSRARWALAACCTVAFAKLVDPQAWMMGLSIPDSAFGIAWQPYRVFSGINAMFLMVFLLFGGLLGDVMGRRRTMLLGVAIAIVANVLCLFSPSPSWFVVWRALEGVGSALAFPMTLAVLQHTFKPRERVVPLLLYSLVTALGAVISLTALAFSSFLGWRATLILPIIAGIAGLLLTRRAVEESRAHSPLDIHRAVVICGWSLVLLAITLGLVVIRQSVAWDSPLTIATVTGAALGGLILLYSRRRAPTVRPEPRLDWHTRHALSVMLLVVVVLNLGLSGFLTQMYTYLTAVQGVGVVLAAVGLAPILVGCVLVVRPMARVAARTTPTRRIVFGLALMAVALVLSGALIGPTMPYWVLMVPMALFGMAFLLSQTAWNEAFLGAIPPELVGASAGTSKAGAQEGAWLGTALLATITIGAGMTDFAKRLERAGVPTELVSTAVAAVGGWLRVEDTGTPPTSLLQSSLLSAYYESYSVGLTASLVWAAGACIVVALLTWVVVRTPEGLKRSAVADAEPRPVGSHQTS